MSNARKGPPQRQGNGNGVRRDVPRGETPPERDDGMPIYEAFWRLLRPAFIWIAAFLMVIGIVAVAFKQVNEKFFAPADIASSAKIKVEIKRGSSVSSIGRQLVEQGVVRNKGVFQYYTEFLGMGGKLKAGTYELSPNMTLKEIVNELAMGDGGQQVTTFRVIEGMNIEEMAQSLVKQNVLTEAKHFLELCKSGEEFADYDFIQAVIDKQQADRRYALEGYLFPDTYEIYVGADEETIIRKMLNRTREIYNVNFLDRADNFAILEKDKKKKMTMDEVLTLASMIEKEAKTNDFDKVSAVFHNRLRKDQKLESCVTVQYALKMRRLVLTGDDLAVDSPYNTYKRAGLPIGPVASPGKDAIEAALYPNTEFVKDGYAYFCSKDPETGELQFSKTLKEHEAASAEYRPLWQAFDDKNKGSNP